ncbi:MAG: type IV fimbrial biogenesis protein FimT [Bacteroidia bacterium]|jgi:type IV fimbrial biogenesis protein FimT
MDSALGPASLQGLTLIELLIVLLIAGLILSAVSPSVTETLHRARLSAEANRLLAALQLARTEAVQRNLTVSVCPSSMARTGVAACDGVYTDGWIIFVNRDRNRTVDENGEPVLHVFNSSPPGYRLTNRAGTAAAAALFSFLSDGTTHSNHTFLFCPPSGSTSNSISIVTNIVGRARLERGVHPCPVG